jgi:PAS domain S-box-containing protein
MPDSSNDPEKQKAAEAGVERFREELGPFVVAAEETRMAIVFTNARVPENPIIFANDAFLELTGWDREEVLGKSFNSLMARGASPEALQEIETAVSGHAEIVPEICYRREDGSQFWASIAISPVRDKSGSIIQHFASFTDQTAQMDERANSKMLIDELNHRVKNTLATVQSIVKQSTRTATDPKVIRESIESRIFALSRSHDILARENWKGAGLHDLIEAALEPFSVTGDRRERFTVEGDNIRLSPKAALALSIAFNELATNAFKYGTFSNNGGTVAVAWTLMPSAEGKRLILHWREQGGPPVTPPSQTGFGTQVIERGLAHELGGIVDLDYRPTGLICTIDVPAQRVAPND